MITITDANGHFITKEVRVGDTVEIVSSTEDMTATFNIDPATLDEILVTDVTSENVVTAEGYVNGSVQTLTLTGASGATVVYKVIHKLTKDEQVDNLVALAESYANKRTVLVWPDSADWLDNDGVAVNLNGSALAAAVVGAMSAYPAQQSFTNLPFAGPYKLYHSNDYFTPSQISRLSNAGIFVLVQSADGGMVSCKWQRSTSNESIQEQEISITKAVDQLSLDLIAAVKPKIGKYNINQDLLTQLSETVDNELFAAKSNKAAYCGALILGYSNVVLRANLDGQNTDLGPTTLEISLTAEVGYPLNFINLKIYVV